jgi:L-asparagine transporter-like permease
MKKSKASLFIASLAINLGAVYFFELTLTFQEVLIIHIFLFVLLFLTDLIQAKLSRHKNVAPSLALSVNFLRILACLFFLCPTILNYEKSDNSYIYNFFFVYFFILFFDIFLKRKNNNKISG